MSFLKTGALALLLCGALLLTACSSVGPQTAGQTSDAAPAASLSLFGPKAGEQVSEDGWTAVVLEDGTLRITACERTETELTVPGTLSGLTVTVLGESTFYGRDSRPRSRCPVR